MAIWTGCALLAEVIVTGENASPVIDSDANLGIAFTTKSIRLVVWRDQRDWMTHTTSRFKDLESLFVGDQFLDPQILLFDMRFERLDFFFESHEAVMTILVSLLDTQIALRAEKLGVLTLIVKVVKQRFVPDALTKVCGAIIGALLVNCSFTFDKVVLKVSKLEHNLAVGTSEHLRVELILHKSVDNRSFLVR